MGKLTVGFWIVLLCTWTARAQVPTGLSGTWKGTRSWESDGRQGQMDLVMLLRQSGNEIAGSFGPSEEVQPLTITEGKIDGNHVIFYVRNATAVMRIRFQLQDGKAEVISGWRTMAALRSRGLGQGRSKQRRCASSGVPRGMDNR
jgi:hypothetical protein